MCTTVPYVMWTLFLKYLIHFNPQSDRAQSRQRGWNIFQRDCMSNKQLTPAEWRELQQDVRRRWSAMPANAKDVYNARAAEETGLRLEAARQPFPSKFELQEGSIDLQGAAFDAVPHLSKNALASISQRRLMVTYKRFKTADVWDDFDAGIACSNGVLHLDHVNLHDKDETLTGQWRHFADALGGSTDNSTAVPEASVQHTTCHREFGHCCGLPHTDLARKYVGKLADLVGAGFWSEVVACGIVLFQLKEWLLIDCDLRGPQRTIRITNPNNWTGQFPSGFSHFILLPHTIHSQEWKLESVKVKQ